MLWCLYSWKLRKLCLHSCIRQSLLSMHCVHGRHQLRNNSMHIHLQQSLHCLLCGLYSGKLRKRCLHCDIRQSLLSLCYVHCRHQL